MLLLELTLGLPGIFGLTCCCCFGFCSGVVDCVYLFLTCHGFHLSLIPSHNKYPYSLSKLGLLFVSLSPGDHEYHAQFCLSIILLRCDCNCNLLTYSYSCPSRFSSLSATVSASFCVARSSVAQTQYYSFVHKKFLNFTHRCS